VKNEICKLLLTFAKYYKLGIHRNDEDKVLGYNHNELLSTDGLNTLTFSDPYARLCFTTMITRAFTNSAFSNQNKGHRRVLYIDTDTTFTAYLSAGLILKNNQTSNYMNSMSDRKNNINSNSTNNNNKGELDYNYDDSRIINTKFRDRDERLVQVFLPSEGRFESLLGDAIASMPEASIVIFDSLNSFYNMYPGSWYESETLEEPADSDQKAAHHETRQSNEQLRKLRETQNKASTNPQKEKSIGLITPPQRTTREKEIGQKWSKPKSPYTTGRLNHLLSIFIMLLVQHGLYYKIPVLVTSMVRYKKVSEDLWVKAPACRRLLNQKSLVRLSAEMLNDNDLSLNIMKHPSLEQQTIVYPNVGISLVSP
jgi:hypothetical protein